MGPKAILQAQPAAPPRTSLLSASLDPILDTGRIETGWEYLPESCPEAGVFDPCEIGHSKTAKRLGPRITAEPFGIFAAFTCSTLGLDPNDLRARARRALQACTPGQVEFEFWTGTQAQASSWDNEFLADGSAAEVVGTGSPSEVIDALACLEGALARCNCGMRSMIHATHEVVTLWDHKGLLRREGELLLTIHDTVVVPGTGYPGTGPNGEAAVAGSVWAYGTDITTAWVEDIEAIPEERVQAISRGVNDETYIAERRAAVSFDACCHFAINVDAPYCGPIGS